MGLYNAGNFLRGIDPAESISLYEEAAKADPSYYARPYWWREKGATHWDSGEVVEAEACYRGAIECGDDKSQAYLGDLLLRTGRYKEALEVLSTAPIWDDPEDAQWRLTFNASRLIVEELGIQRQERDSLGVPDFYPDVADDSIDALERTALSAIHADALNAWAYSALAAVWVADDRERALLASATAAVLVNTDGSLWINLVAAVLEGRSDAVESRDWVGVDAFICAQSYLGDHFVDDILNDPMLTEEARAGFIELYETFRLPSPPMEVRDYGGGADYQSVFIPTGPQR
jgi:tetratricopeptide (TPR) repeat protein